MAKVLTGNSKRYQHVLSFSKSTGLFRQKLLPTAEELLKPRENHEVFKTFCDTFVSCTYGKKEFQKLCTDKTISKFVTVSDEAYTVAYLHNCYEGWMDQANAPDKANRADWTKKKWTSEAHAASKYKGWNDEGLNFYNKIQLSITNERKTDESKHLEVEYREDSWQTNESSKKKGGKKKTETAAVKIHVDFTKLDSDDENGDRDFYGAGAGNTKDSALDLYRSTDEEENGDEEEDDDEEENDDNN